MQGFFLVFGHILCQNIDGEYSGFTGGKSAKEGIRLTLVSPKQPDLSGNGCTTNSPQCIANSIEQKRRAKQT